MHVSVFFSLIAGTIYCIGFVDYNRNIFKGRNKPNYLTWAIWSAEGVVFTTTYLLATKDIWKGMIPIINVVFCIATFFIALFIGKFKKINLIEWLSVAIGLTTAVAVLLIFKSATYANYISQAVIIAGFIPTWRGIWNKPSNELARPWLIWTLSYFIATIVVVLRWNGHLVDIIYPINCILLHVSIPIICMIRNVKTRVLQKQEKLYADLPT